MLSFTAIAAKQQLDAAERAAMAEAIGRATGMRVYQASLFVSDGYIYGFARDKRLMAKALILWRPEEPAPEASVDFLGEVEGLRLVAGPADFENAGTFMKALPFLKPVLLGTGRAGGLGDRLGLATPGHVRAAREHPGIRPLFAQQSIREMGRTGRSAKEVMADAVFGVLQEGWTDGFGSDADHLKKTGDIDRCAAAGFTMYTIDPGEHVENRADGMVKDELAEKAAALPWEALESTLPDTISRYAKKVILPGEVGLETEAEDIVRAAVKYGRAVAHVAGMYRHLAAKALGGFELEVSVDETETPTSAFEHYYVASELKRLGVEWVSLAPRFVGRFEKGVDYIGGLLEFRECFRRHVAVMKALGYYKLSLHSGSDKFSVYPILADEAGEFVHLKTAGTSYLAALMALAKVEPEFVKSIYRFATERYPEDKATYHVSADLLRLPRPEALKDAELPALIEEFNARQVLHVTFGSVLTARSKEGEYVFRDRLYRLLKEHEEEHLEELRRHLGRHLAPFSTKRYDENACTPLEYRWQETRR